ncbi:MAG: carbon-nitrogen hydrolase family protein [Planctomycetota bacterium]|jgi:predicted amidohydrolase
MAKGKIKIATCQFAVTGSIRRNSRQIQNMMKKAASDRADIAHFPECSLSGYAGFDFDTFDGYDWPLLKAESKEIMALAKKLRLWIVLGSSHPLTEPNKPHNCLYLINPAGKIVDRYDKRFGMPLDLQNYTPGNHFVNFKLNGVNCALLICFDARFPELYRQLWQQGVQCLFQSFYNARQNGPSVHTHIMRQSMQCRAATNQLWVSMCNSSGYYAPYPSCFIQPDGKIVRQLKQNRAGIMINTVDLKKKFYDPMAGFRELAMKGVLTNGPRVIRDPRSGNTATL